MRSHGVKNHEVANVVETRMQWGLINGNIELKCREFAKRKRLFGKII